MSHIDFHELYLEMTIRVFTARAHTLNLSLWLSWEIGTQVCLLERSVSKKKKNNNANANKSAKTTHSSILLILKHKKLLSTIHILPITYAIQQCILNILKITRLINKSSQFSDTGIKVYVNKEALYNQLKPHTTCSWQNPIYAVTVFMNTRGTYFQFQLKNLTHILNRISQLRDYINI